MTSKHTPVSSPRGLIRKAVIGLKNTPARASESVVKVFPKKPRKPIEGWAIPPEPYTGPKEFSPVRVSNQAGYFRRHSVVVKTLRKVG